MTGPSLPRPVPGSNAIGRGQIGVMQIGDISPFDPWATIISQYANSPIIDALITSFNAAMDLTEPLSNWYDLVMNVLTAEGYGLDVWGRIVNVGRTLAVTNSGPSIKYLGFEEASDSTETGFNQGIFFSGASGPSQNFTLTDPDYRRLILAKAAGNISDGSIPSVNAILLALFPNRGAAFVQNNRNMSVNYVFRFTLSPVDLAIVSQANVLPTAAGVSVTIEQA